MDEQARPLPRTLLRFVWHFSRNYKSAFLSLIFVAFFWAGSLSLKPFALKLIIDKASVPGLTPQEIMSSAFGPALLYVLVGFFIDMICRFYDWVRLRVFPNMKSEITQEMFDYLEQHSYAHFQSNLGGSLANKINDMAKGLPSVISIVIDYFLTSVLALIVGCATMYSIHPYFASIMGIWGLLFIGISYFFSKKSQKYAAQFSENRSTAIGKMVDSFSNILNVKLFARESAESRGLNEALEKTTSADKKLQWYLLKIKAFHQVSTALLTGFMTWLLIHERANGSITVGDFALILTLMTSLIDEIYILNKQLISFSEDLGMCKQALTALSSSHEIVDDKEATQLKIEKGTITFDKVFFHYNRNQKIFSDKSITILAGQKVGLVGFSGSGKSTFVNLILRFFDVNGGRILIDGQNIQNVTQHSLRSQIALIPQDPILFHRSILENIRYGKQDATFDEVVQCAIKAHCHDFIMKLPDQYNSFAGERGVKLSGGQRQRIAIARAILKNAPIFILDEATAALDSVTESYIQNSLEKLMEGKTTLVIAHRLSTLSKMDRILVFDKGAIVEDGSHEELLMRNGHYTTLWNMQAGGFISGLSEN